MGKPTRLIEFQLLNGKRGWVRPEEIAMFWEASTKDGADHIIIQVDGRGQMAVIGTEKTVLDALSSAEAISSHIIKAPLP